MKVYTPGISISNNWSHVVKVGGGFALLGGQPSPGVPLLAIVHRLGLEQPLDLVRYGVVRVVAKIRRDLVGAGQEGGTCPAGNVQDLLVGGLLGHLHRVNGTHC